MIKKHSVLLRHIFLKILHEFFISFLFLWISWLHICDIWAFRFLICFIIFLKFAFLNGSCLFGFRFMLFGFSLLFWIIVTILIIFALLLALFFKEYACFILILFRVLNYYNNTYSMFWRELFPFYFFCLTPPFSVLLSSFLLSDSSPSIPLIYPLRLNFYMSYFTKVRFFSGSQVLSSGG